MQKIINWKYIVLSLTVNVTINLQTEMVRDISRKGQRCFYTLLEIRVAIVCVSECAVCFARGC